MAPTLVSRAAAPSSSLVIARPKSAMRGTPSATITLSGLKSRWIRPRSWACARPSHSPRAIATTSATGVGPASTRAPKVVPSTKSMTMYRRPASDRPKSITRTTLG